MTIIRCPPISGAAEALSTQNHRNNRGSLTFKYSEYFSDAPSAHDDKKQRQVIEFDHRANNASLRNRSYLQAARTVSELGTNPKKVNFLLNRQAMPIDYAQELIKLAGVTEPNERPTPEDWQELEAELGMEFPSDFKTLVTALGSGSFGCGLGLKNPRASSQYAQLSKAALIEYASYSADIAKEVNVPLYPDPQGLVAIGGIDRQEFLFRPDSSGRRLEEFVWWDIDYNEFKVLGMSVSQFIHDLYLGRINEEWAADLRKYFWRNGKEPLFTVWRGPMLGPAPDPATLPVALRGGESRKLTQEELQQQYQADLEEIRRMGLFDRAINDFATRIPNAVVETWSIGYFVDTTVVWCSFRYSLPGDAESRQQGFGYSKRDSEEWTLSWDDDY